MSFKLISAPWLINASTTCLWPVSDAFKFQEKENYKTEANNLIRVPINKAVRSKISFAFKSSRFLINNSDISSGLVDAMLNELTKSNFK